ncbi:MAG: hypothetical protein JWO51_5353 [Rhodospirillales bacterium]|nr:hypothetical protein [Rhodospirillales bacterium]
MKAVLKELFGLFVDDASLAIGLLIWVAIAGYVLPLLSLGSWSGPMLALGIAIVLVVSLRKVGR